MTPDDSKRQTVVKNSIWPNAIHIDYDEILVHIQNGRDTADSIAAYYQLGPGLLGYNDTCWALVKKLRYLEQMSKVKEDSNGGSPWPNFVKYVVKSRV